MVGLIRRLLFIIYNLYLIILTTIFDFNRLEKAAKAEKEESSEQENPREHLNLDQAGLDFR